MKFLSRSATILFLLGVGAVSLSAQKVEIYPNAGGFFPNWTEGFNHNKLKSDGIYSVKGGVFMGENAQLEGSFGYINHFELKNPPNSFAQPTVFGMLYDVNATYNFGQRHFLSSRVSPFVTAGVGGLTTEVRHGSSTFIQGGDPLSAGRSIMMNDDDSFLTVNYGVGVKALNLWGPVGLRVDARARTLPNFFGRSITWAEPSAGLVFSWGER